MGDPITNAAPWRGSIVLPAQSRFLPRGRGSLRPAALGSFSGSRAGPNGEFTGGPEGHNDQALPGCALERRFRRPAGKMAGFHP